MRLERHSTNRAPNLTSTKLFTLLLTPSAAQVAHFLRDTQSERWAEELAIAVHQLRRPGQLWGEHLLPQLSDLPDAILDSILRHLVSMTPFGLAARLLHQRFFAAAVRVRMHAGHSALHLHDQFQCSADLERFLHDMPQAHPLASLAITFGKEPNQRLFVQDDADSALTTYVRSQPRLRAADFSGLQLGAASLTHGLPALGSSLQSLSVARCALTRHGPALLANVIFALPALTHLDISSNGIQAHDGATIAAAVATLTALRTLRVSGNGLRIAGAEALALALPALGALTALDLSNNVLQAAGIAALAPRLTDLPALASLDVSGSMFASPGAALLAYALPTLPALETLRLARCAVGDAGVAALRAGLAPPVPARPPPLTQLCLNNNTLSRHASDDLGAVLHALRGTLRSLDVSCNRINWGAPALSGALATMHQLETLRLRENNMHNSGYAALLPAIVHLPRLSHFDVSDNLLTSDPLGLLLEAIASQGPPCEAAATPYAPAWPAGGTPVIHATLTTLDASNMAGGSLGSPTLQLQAEQLAAAAAAVPGAIDGGAAAGDGDGPPDVTVVVSDALQHVFDRVLANIHRCERSSICAAASRVRMPHLQRLLLSGLPDSVQCAVPLLRSCGASLVELNLDSVSLRPALAAALAAPLRACTALISLNLANNACMGPLGGARLANSVRAVLPHLHHLQLSGCGHPGAMIVRACFPDDATDPARAAHALLALRSLSLSHTAVDQATAVPLLLRLARRAPRLRRLDLGDTDIAAGGDRRSVQSALARLTQITMLNLANVEGFAVPDWDGLWPHVPM